MAKKNISVRMFFSIILIPLVFSPCYSASSIKDPSNYLFGNTELITKADFLEAFDFDSKGLNKNLIDLSYELSAHSPDLPFYRYIKENYFELFKTSYLEAKQRRGTGHLLGNTWKKIYVKMLEKTKYKTPSAAFERLFGIHFCGFTPEFMCRKLKRKLFKFHNEWTFIFEKGAFGETKFAVTFTLLIFKLFGPSDKQPQNLVSDMPLRTSLDSHYLLFENPQSACFYESICHDNKDRTITPSLPDVFEPMATDYFSEAKSAKESGKNKGTRKKRTMKRGKNVKNSLKQKKIPRVHYSFNSQNEYINFLNSAEQYPDSQFDQQIDLNASNDRQVELYAPVLPTFYDRCRSVFDPLYVYNTHEYQNTVIQNFHHPDLKESMVPNTGMPSCSINQNSYNSPPVPLDLVSFPGPSNMDILPSSSQSATFSVKGDFASDFTDDKYRRRSNYHTSEYLPPSFFLY